jgi:hypothetical protein
MDRAATDRPMMYSLRVRRSNAYFVRIAKGQLTLVTELVDAEKMTRDEAEAIRKLLMEQWGLRPGRKSHQLASCCGNCWDFAGLRLGLICSHESRDSGYARRISVEARKRPMVRMVFDLLVRTNGAYHNFRVTSKGSWGWAQKKTTKDKLPM